MLMNGDKPDSQPRARRLRLDGTDRRGQNHADQPVDALYEINGGTITVDGVNIQDMPREELAGPFRHGAAGHMAF